MWEGERPFGLIRSQAHQSRKNRLRDFQVGALCSLNFAQKRLDTSYETIA